MMRVLGALIASASAPFLVRQFFLTVPDELILFLYGRYRYLRLLLVTTDPDMTTAVVALKNPVPQSDTAPAWNVAMCGALLTTLPRVPAVMPLRRSLIRGLVESGR